MSDIDERAQPRHGEEEALVSRNRGAPKTLEARDRKAGKDQTKLKQKDLMRAQSAVILAERLKGKTLDTLSKEFNLGHRTVRRRIATGSKDQILEMARMVIIEELLPKSIAALQQALEGTDVRLATQVALKLVNDLEILQAPTTMQQTEEETFESWRAQLPEDTPAGSFISIQAVPQTDLDEPSYAGAQGVPLPALTGEVSEAPSTEAAGNQTNPRVGSSPPSDEARTGDSPATDDEDDILDWVQES